MNQKVNKVKTYQETVQMMAQSAFGSYLGGSNSIWAGLDFGTVAFIYGVTSRKVELSVQDAYDEQVKAYYAKFIKEQEKAMV